jgi:hypothetical protein
MRWCARRRSVTIIWVAKLLTLPRQERESPALPGLVVQVAAAPQTVDASSAAGLLRAAVAAGAGNRAVARLAAPRSSRVLARAPGRTLARGPLFVDFHVKIDHRMDKDEFAAVAMTQIFGGPVPRTTWTHRSEFYEPGDHTVKVDVDLVKRVRGERRRGEGVDVGAGDSADDAATRAKDFQDAPRDSPERQRLMDEIDRRYWASVGDTSNTKIKRGERGKAELWKAIRDEVLYQREFLQYLPDDVDHLIGVAMDGHAITPENYDRVFAMARKLERLGPGALQDYMAKQTDPATSLEQLDASIDRYLQDLDERGKKDDEFKALKARFVGMEPFYERYRLYVSMLMTNSISAGLGAVNPRSAGMSAGMSQRIDKMRRELDAEVKRYGFNGLDDFEAGTKEFLRRFERGAVEITKDVLARYDATLARETRRYADQGEVSGLYQRLGAYRTNYGQIVKEAETVNQLEARRRVEMEPSRIPGQGHLQPATTTVAEINAATARAESARDAAKQEIANLTEDYPVFAEESLPVDQRIDKRALYEASETGLQGVLSAHLQHRRKAVAAAAADLDANPEQIYKLDKLMPQFYSQQRIKAGSIFDMIIQDKLHDDAIVKMVIGLVVAVVAVALSVITFGAATPALVAAGTAVLSVGLSGYMAIQEYEEYVEQKHFADVGLRENPSTLWLTLAIIGTGVDAAFAVKAVRALLPAAKALEAGGDIATFQKAVKALEEQGEIESRIARVAEQAAETRKALAEATAELGRTLGSKVYGFPGPFADPDVYRSLVKMARLYIRGKVYDLQAFIEDLKLLRVNAKLGELTPEELQRAKQAWEEAKAAEAAEEARLARLRTVIPDGAKLEELIAKAGDSARLERLLSVWNPGELEAVFGVLKDPTQLATIVDNLGANTGKGIVNDFIKAGQKDPAALDKLNTFAGRLSGAGSVLTEQTALSAQSLVIDSNTAIALVKDSDPVAQATMHAGERARVAAIRGMPAGTDLRITNVTAGETPGTILGQARGVPLSVSREAPEYQALLSELERLNVGQAKGAADRGLIADTFFAKTEATATPRLMTSDRQAVKALAAQAGIDIQKSGGFPGIVKAFGPTGTKSVGFNVTVSGRTITLIPVE